MRTDDNLKAEYLLIQSQYEAYDQRALSLKALSAPLLGAGLAVGAKGDGRGVIDATLLVAGSLWLLEAVWKGFQFSFEDRIKLLESWFRGEGREDEPPFQIYTAWLAVGWQRKLPHIVKCIFKPFVFLPYVIFIIIGLSIRQ